MRNFLSSSFFFNYLNYDILHKYHIKNYYKIPKIKSLLLFFNIKIEEMHQILYTLLFLEIISLQKPVLIISKGSKRTLDFKTKIQIKIKKGNILGCKVRLHKINLINFFTLLIIHYLPVNKEILKILNKKSKHLSITLLLRKLSGFPLYLAFVNNFDFLKNIILTITFTQPITLSLFFSFCFFNLKKNK